MEGTAEAEAQRGHMCGFQPLRDIQSRGDEIREVMGAKCGGSRSRPIGS